MGITSRVNTGRHYNLSVLRSEENAFVSSPSAWLQSLVDVVASSMASHSGMGPLGYRYREEPDLAEVIIYPTPVELVGGEEDGALVISGFTLDIQSLLSAFEPVMEIHWYSRGLGLYSSEGAAVSIEGVYQGHLVWLQILADPPADEQAGMRLDTSPPARRRP